MGQYYRGVILKKDFRESYRDKEAEVVVKPLDCGVGSKLIELSYFGNSFMLVLEDLLYDKFYGYPFVLCGDYADDIRMVIEGLNEDEFAEKYGEGNEIIPYGFDSLYKKDFKIPAKSRDYRYIINLSKKQYVDLNRQSVSDWNPLALLCCSGNGRGGGDYWGTNMDKVGIWAYDNIGLGNILSEGYEEIEVNFEE